MQSLLALDERPPGGSAAALYPPGWGVLAAGKVLAGAGPGEVHPERAYLVVGRLIDLYWRGEFEGQRRRALALLSRLGSPEISRYFLQAARSPDPRVRERSAEALAALTGPRVAQGLLSLLKDPEVSVRAAACLALGGQGDASSVEPLVERLKDAAGRVRRSAAEALGFLGERRAAPALLGALPALLRALEDPGIALRKKAAEALGKIGDPDVLAALAGRLRTGSVPEKWAAAETLADWRAPEAVPPLAAALSDPSARVRKRAAYALGNLAWGSARPFPEAVEALGEALSDASEEVRGRAAFALGLTGSPRAARFLAKALRDESDSVRRKAADSLAAVVAGASEAQGVSPEEERDLEAGRGALRALSRDEDADLRFRAAFGLAFCGGADGASALERVREAAGQPPALAPLSASLRFAGASLSPLRRRALEVLGRAGGAAEAGLLREGLEDGDPGVRRAAAEALGRVRVEGGRDPADGERVEGEVREALATALGDVDARVREAAWEGWVRRLEREETQGE